MSTRIISLIKSLKAVLRFVKHIDIDYVRNSEERDQVSAALGNKRLCKEHKGIGRN